VSYDADLANRIRLLIGAGPDVTEKKMFGGLAFLIGGNMAVAASSDGGAMVRVDPREGDALIAQTPASPMEMRGRAMSGWLRIEPQHLRDDDDLAAWVDRSARYARSLPPKR
jgi:TfoX/Sxy family transcriptional regulator of competence genes